MAPIKKSRRRALMELDDIKWWFSDVLSDHSYMFRYEHIDYPDSDWDDIPPSFWDRLDDEFLHGQSTYQSAKIRELFNPPIDEDSQPLFMNPRFKYLTNVVPFLFIMTTAAFMIPSTIHVTKYISNKVGSWVRGLFSSQDESSSTPTPASLTKHGNDDELLRQYIDEYTSLAVPIQLPTLLPEESSHPHQHSLMSYKRYFSNQPNTTARDQPISTSRASTTDDDSENNNASDVSTEADHQDAHVKESEQEEKGPSGSPVFDAVDISKIVQIIDSNEASTKDGNEIGTVTSSVFIIDEEDGEDCGEDNHDNMLATDQRMEQDSSLEDKQIHATETEDSEEGNEEEGETSNNSPGDPFISDDNSSNTNRLASKIYTSDHSVEFVNEDEEY